MTKKNREKNRRKNKKKPLVKASKPLSQAEKESKQEKEATDQKDLVFSFKDFDRTQGQSFKDWEEEGLLSDALEKLHWHSQDNIGDLKKSKKLILYGNFPSKEKTSFIFPKNIQEEDLHWSRIGIKGKSRIIGHMIKNVFYIVFLDKNHEFWLSKK